MAYPVRGGDVGKDGVDDVPLREERGDQNCDASGHVLGWDEERDCRDGGKQSRFVEVTHEVVVHLKSTAHVS